MAVEKRSWVRKITRSVADKAVVHGALTLEQAVLELDARQDWLTFVIDVGIGGDENGLGLLEQVRERHPSKPVCLVVPRDNERVLRIAAEMNVYVTARPADHRKVAEFVARARRGLNRGALESALLHVSLTRRERAIVLAKFDGLSNIAIGTRECIATKTVETHVTNILRKTRAPSIVALIDRLQRLG